MRLSEGVWGIYLMRCSSAEALERLGSTVAASLERGLGRVRGQRLFRDRALGVDASRQRELLPSNVRAHEPQRQKRVRRGTVLGHLHRGPVALGELDAVREEETDVEQRRLRVDTSRRKEAAC